MKQQHKADLALLLVTVGWGASFILTKNALEDLPTFNFLFVRFLLAFIIGLLAFPRRWKCINRETLYASFIVGTVLFAGYAVQTIGLHYTTVSKSAFITGFSVVLVPLLTTLFMRKFPEQNAIVGSAMALLGLGLLTLNGSLGINLGDLLTFISAFAFALHIITVGHYTNKCDSLMLGIFQIGVVGCWSLLASFFFETPTIPGASSVWINLIFLSIFCTAGAFIIQSIAQKYTTATHTALIYTGEPVFAAFFGYIIAGEVLSPRGLLGAVLILLGMITAELNLKSLFYKPSIANKKAN